MRKKGAITTQSQLGRRRPAWLGPLVRFFACWFAVEMVRALKLPFAVVINRADVGDGDTKAYCTRQRIEVLAEVPDDHQVAEAYSRGEMACDVIPKYRELYRDLLNSLAKRIPAYAG
jgi:hypothetical protein